MTIGTICQDALSEIGGFAVPSTFFGNGNLTAKQCLALVKAAGNSLERDHRLSALIDTHTFTTVPDQASYDLPEDFRAFANMSQWDRTANMPVIGPTPAYLWQFLKSGIAQGATINRWFRIQGGKFYIHPTPSDAAEIAFDYYSKYWIVKQSDGSSVSTFFSDNDTTRIDEFILSRELKWRFLQAKGMPFEAEYREADALIQDYLADDGGKGKICLGKSPLVFNSLPDTGFGS